MEFRHVTGAKTVRVPRIRADDARHEVHDNQGRRIRLLTRFVRQPLRASRSRAQPNRRMSTKLQRSRPPRVSVDAMPPASRASLASFAGPTPTTLPWYVASSSTLAAIIAASAQHYGPRHRPKWPAMSATGPRRRARHGAGRASACARPASPRPRSPWSCCRYALLPTVAHGRLLAAVSTMGGTPCRGALVGVEHRQPLADASGIEQMLQCVSAERRRARKHRWVHWFQNLHGPGRHALYGSA